ncbi:hypothetical protein LCGC14_1860350, partial [marine sediment metagenome]
MSLSIHDSGADRPCPAPFNLAAHVLRQAATRPDAVALEVVGGAADTVWTYAQLQAAVLGIATGLSRLGLSPGDRILMRLGNSIDFPLLYLGAMAADLVPIPTSPQLTTAEIGKLSDLVTPAIVAAAPGVALPERDLPILTLDALRAMRDLPAMQPVLGDPNRPGYIVFSSGTSGAARAVAHAHRAIWARRDMVDGWYELSAEDRLLHAGAFNWTYTMGTGLMDPWSVGATALIPAEGLPADRLPALLAKHEVTLFAAAPGVFRQILKASELPALPHLRHGLSAGEKLPDITRDRWAQMTGTAIHEAYGMSECSTFVSGSPSSPAPFGTLGRPQPGRRVAVLGSDGPVPRNTAGELAVSDRDPGLMLGYLNDPEATRARRRGEWFLTGDMASMDDSGALTYLGRDDDLMNAGGFRVSPLEVEDVLTGFPGVIEAAAAEISVKADASIIAAFYVAPDDLDADALAAHCAQSLARYKCPRSFIRLPVLPRGANGKLLRRQLRHDHSRKA